MTQGQHYATSSYTEKRKSKSRKRTLIIALIAIAIIAVIGFVACQNLFGDKTGQVRQGAEIEVVIPAGASTDKIASILVDDGVIPSAKAFTDRVKQLGQASSLQSGSYLLIGGDDIDTIIKILASGQTGRQLVIPEGYNLRQIADKVEATCGASMPRSSTPRRRRLPITSPTTPSSRASTTTRWRASSIRIRTASIRPPRPMTSSA